MKRSFRHPSKIAEEMEWLVGQYHDSDQRRRAHRLIYELAEQMVPSPEQAPPIAAACHRIFRAAEKILPTSERPG